MPYFSESKSASNANVNNLTPQFMPQSARFRQNSARNNSSNYHMHDTNPFGHASVHESNLESQTYKIDEHDESTTTHNKQIIIGVCAAICMILILVAVIVYKFWSNQHAFKTTDHAQKTASMSAHDDLDQSQNINVVNAKTESASNNSTGMINFENINIHALIMFCFFFVFHLNLTPNIINMYMIKPLCNILSIVKLCTKKWIHRQFKQ